MSANPDGSAKGTPIPADRIARIADMICSKIKPDIIVLSEVWPAEAASDIAKKCTEKGFPLEAIVPAQKPTVVQLVAFLKKPGITVQDVGLIKDSDDLLPGDAAEEKTSRAAICATMKINNFDFHIIGVHLKSKTGGADKAIPMRDRQCKAISTWMKEHTQGAEKDVLLIGDYNMTPAAEVHGKQPADTKNFETLASEVKLDFISDSVKGGTHVSKSYGISRLDGYAVSPGADREYIKKSFTILTHDELGLKKAAFLDKNNQDYVTDHYPILARFNTDTDDD